MAATLIHRSQRDDGAIWQGGADDVVEAGTDRRFDVVVLCAEEWQPEARLIVRPGVAVVHAPNDDGGAPLTKGQVRIAVQAAREVAKAYRAGRRVLVSCVQGRNRSGLVTAITLHLVCGVSGRRAQAIIRSKIPTALTNRDFQRFLAQLPSKLPKDPADVRVTTGQRPRQGS